MLFQVYSQHGQSTRSINGPNNDNDLKSKASQIIDLSFWMVSNRFYINLYIHIQTRIYSALPYLASASAKKVFFYWSSL